MTYFEKLKHPLWQKKRLEVFERENFTCQSCGGAGKTLHVHHTYYKPDYEPWDYPLDSLQCLCEYCHNEQKIKKEHLAFISEQLKNINTGVYTVEEIVGYIHIQNLTCKTIDAIDRNATIELTNSIIIGMCIMYHWQMEYKEYCDEKMKLYSFLDSYIEKGRKTITYGEVLDFLIACKKLRSN